MKKKIIFFILNLQKAKGKKLQQQKVIEWTLKTVRSIEKRGIGRGRYERHETRGKYIYTIFMLNKFNAKNLNFTFFPHKKK